MLAELIMAASAVVWVETPIQCPMQGCLVIHQSYRTTLELVAPLKVQEQFWARLKEHEYLGEMEPREEPLPAVGRDHLLPPGWKFVPPQNPMDGWGIRHE